VPAGPIKQEATSKVALLEQSNGNNVECKTLHGTDEWTSPTTGTGKSVFEDCEALGQKCTTASEPTGDIVSEQNHTLGWISKAEGKVGVDFTEIGSKGLASYECPGTNVIKETSGGSLIALSLPNDESATTSHIVAEGEGKAPKRTQQYEKLEGAAKDTIVSKFSIKGGPFEEVQGIENIASELTVNLPEEVKKGKKVTKYPDPAEVRTEVGGSQLATPEIGHCYSDPKKGHYKDAKCHEKVASKGSFEWKAA